MREQINEFVTKKEEVVHQLNTLGIQNAAGTDAIHPLIVKTLAETDNFSTSLLSLQEGATY